MDEDITIINSNNRYEKVKNFFLKNKKKIILVIVIIILTPLILFSYLMYEKGHKKWLSDKYNSAIINYKTGDKTIATETMKEIINHKDKTYSPLALYFLIDNDIISSNEEINKYFDVIINEVSLDKEIKNLIIYKKGLFIADFESENNLIKTLNPIINSDSVWKSHALYLLAEFFYDKNQYEKAKQFYNKILSNEKSNEKIVLEVQKRLNRDLSE
tara:strand:+ start:326 stop:970 length:645 start_codon:yes stop_codon:yes gene_type:complete